MNYFQNPKIGEVALLRELDDNAGDGSHTVRGGDMGTPGLFLQGGITLRFIPATLSTITQKQDKTLWNT